MMYMERDDRSLRLVLLENGIIGLLISDSLLQMYASGLVKYLIDKARETFAWDQCYPMRLFLRGLPAF